MPTETLNFGSSGMAKALARRRNWPSGFRRYVASLYLTTPETWERVVDFIEQARG